VIRRARDQGSPGAGECPISAASAGGIWRTLAITLRTEVSGAPSSLEMAPDGWCLVWMVRVDPWPRKGLEGASPAGYAVIDVGGRKSAEYP